MRWHGSVGFGVTEETDPINHPHVNQYVIIEKKCYGDVLQNSRAMQNSQYANDDIRVNVRISIISNQYIWKHFSEILYVDWQHSKWKVSNVEIQYPRLILTLGGLYNGETPENPGYEADRTPGK